MIPTVKYHYTSTRMAKTKTLIMSGTSLAVQWLRLLASTTRGIGSISGWGTKFPMAHGMAKKAKH